MSRIECFAFALFYIVSSLVYYFTIWITNQAYTNYSTPFWNFSNYISSSGVDYLLKMLFTIPIWVLIFRIFLNIPSSKKILFHLVLFPLFIVSHKFLYYKISQYLGWGRLSGFLEIWDYYISSLFYILQFSFFHAYDYYHQNNKQLLLASDLKESKLKSELSALKAQLNPHFLFNVFNTINASLPKNQDNTRLLITKLASLFRYQTKASKEDFVPLKDEITFIKDYLSLEKERFGERLSVEISVDYKIENTLIPPMLIQPIVENSIKHGISDLIEGGTISIKISKEKDFIKFEISDTGKGIENKSNIFGIGVGLTNTKLRLEKMYQSDLIVADNHPRGTLIKFSINV
ncbi:hypothetical protein BTO18_12045 [Polaribacter porphyrae]|uniref:Sensor histidine kinase n=1 Tax=Polaribacter porphyrae TaxID=1137780 RepID=A0A2S7WTS2_9FLAO|nr:hypothetical protein BTO18_12045 [Polaribacter porphyrae]